MHKAGTFISNQTDEVRKGKQSFTCSALPFNIKTPVSTVPGQEARGTEQTNSHPAPQNTCSKLDLHRFTQQC